MKRINCNRFEEEPDTEQITFAGHPDYEAMPLNSVAAACDKALIRRGAPSDHRIRSRAFVCGWAAYQATPFDNSRANP